MATSYHRMSSKGGMGSSEDGMQPLRRGLLVRRNSFHAPGEEEDPEGQKDTQEMKARNKTTCQHLWRLFKAIGPEKWWIILGSLSAVIQVGMSLVQPTLTGRFFNELYYVVGSVQQDNLNSAHFYLKLMGGFYALQIVFSLLTGTLFGIAARKIVARLRITLFSRYLCQEMGFFDQKSVGELISRLQTDVGLLQSVTTTFSSLLNIFVTVVGSLVWMFQINWIMTLVSLSSAPFLAFFSVVFGNIIRKKTTLSFDVLAMQNQCAQEVLSYIRTVRGYDQEIREGNRYMSLTMRVYRIGLQLLAVSQVCVDDCLVV